MKKGRKECHTEKSMSVVYFLLLHISGHALACLRVDFHPNKRACTQLEDGIHEFVSGGHVFTAGSGVDRCDYITENK